MPPVVLIIEDRSEARELAHGVERLGYRASTFASGWEFLSSADRSEPGCIVLDHHLRDMSGHDVQEKLVAEKCVLPVIVVARNATVPMCVRSMQLGAMHFFEKPAEEAAFEHVLREAIVRDAEARERAGVHARSRSLFYRLDEAEQRLVTGLAQGLATKELAAQLAVSVRTVQSRVNRVLAKLQLDDRHVLARLGLEMLIHSPVHPLAFAPPHFKVPAAPPAAEPASPEPVTLVENPQAAKPPESETIVPPDAQIVVEKKHESNPLPTIPNERPAAPHDPPSLLHQNVLFPPGSSTMEPSDS